MGEDHNYLGGIIIDRVYESTKSKVPGMVNLDVSHYKNKWQAISLQLKLGPIRVGLGGPLLGLSLGYKSDRTGDGSALTVGLLGMGYDTYHDDGEFRGGRLTIFKIPPIFPGGMRFPVPRTAPAW